LLTSAELCLVADEILRLAVPARLDKIHQPREDRVVFRLAKDGTERNLLVAAVRGFARAHFVEAPPANPRTPPPFCEDLRRLLTPGRLAGASTLPNDAVLLLDFEVRDDRGAIVPRRFVAELFGAHPNLLVLAADGTILAVLAPRESRARRLATGERWIPPARPERDLAPVPPFAELGEPPKGVTISQLLERAVTPRETASFVAAAREQILGTLRQQEKKLARRLENIDADVKGADAIPALRREGELLKAHVGAMKRGMKTFVATSWESGREEPVTIALDPKRTPSQEVAFRFDEARRLERLKEAAAERRGEVEERLRAIARIAARAESAATEEELDAVRADGGLAERPAPAPGKKPKPVVEPRKPYRTFVSKDGIDMLVGRTASDNDELTFRIANGNDFWFHVRDFPGSHVVIRGSDQLPEETMLDAATLAVHFSRAPEGGKRDVSWTRRKYVSKARRAPPGQVLLSSHKTIHLRPDPERLARLLKGKDE
jgi:predicted ribosome quality control (RQC) complex YloA/Tae2 family protein